MLKRYTQKEMQELWSEKNKFSTYLKVELLAAEAFSKLGEIPSEDLEKLWKNADFSLERIHEIEAETKHDVIAFTRAVSEHLGDEKKWIHYGLTSTDVVDTAYGVLYQQANQYLEEKILKLLEVLKKKSYQYKNTACIGRTHGVHAEITSFGLKFALWYDEMKRQLKRFQLARNDIEVGKISGAVGTFAHTPPFVQDYVCQRLGLKSSNISTQILQRDRHAFYFSTLALIGSTLEKMATEIRHLQRTEVREVEEYFNKGQKGSSAMPHKRNPIASENICGCARILRGYMLSAFENIPLWHERDISHSSAERIIAPDATTLLHYMLHRFTTLLEKLTVFEENMLKNIHTTFGVIFSQRFVLKLIEKGFSREEAYDLIQPLALKAFTTQSDFKHLILQDPVLKNQLSHDEIEDAFSVKHHLKNVEIILERVFHP